MKRIRLSTLMLAMALVGLGLALIVQQRRADRREAQLLSALSLYRDLAREAIVDGLEEPMTLAYPRRVPLQDVLKTIKAQSIAPAIPTGFPIYVDPVSLQEAGATMISTVTTDSTQESLPVRVHLRRILKPLGLTYGVKNGLLVITSEESADEPLTDDPYLLYRHVLK